MKEGLKVDVLLAERHPKPRRHADGSSEPVPNVTDEESKSRRPVIRGGRRHSREDRSGSVAKRIV